PGVGRRTSVGRHGMPACLIVGGTRPPSHMHTFDRPRTTPPAYTHIEAAARRSPLPPGQGRPGAAHSSGALPLVDARLQPKAMSFIPVRRYGRGLGPGHVVVG